MCDKMNRKSRGANFSKEEELLLLEEVEREKNIIECKITNKISNVDKEQAWGRVMHSFNAKSFACRTIDQLKSKYDNLKTKARKAVASRRVYLKGTGGGPSYVDSSDPIIEAVLKIINVKTVVGLQSQFDSDSFSNDCDIENNASTSAGESHLFNSQSFPILVPEIEFENQNDEGDHTYILTQSFLDNTLIPANVIEEEILGNEYDANVLKEHTGSNISPKTSSLKRPLESNWSHYVPRKLKEPVSKKLRPTIQNPVIKAKEEYYKIKTQFLENEVQEQKRKFELGKQEAEWKQLEYQRRDEREKREEERKEEEHKRKMQVLDLQIQKLKKELKEIN